MKHLLLSLSLFLLSLTAGAEDFTYEYEGQTLTYTIIDKSARTCKLKRPGNNVSGDLIIPSEAGDFRHKYKVIEIPYMAFWYCRGLTSVTIPNSVTSIGESAFYGCSGLTSVTIPNSVTSIGRSAFKDCSGLTSVTILDGVTVIGEHAFHQCGSLTSVTIPSTVTHIQKEAFSYCSGLTKVNISDIAAWCKIKYEDPYSNPLSCAHHLYLNGEEVTNLVIPDGVTSINDYAFSGCSSLTSMTIPNSVTSIGSGAFLWCHGLTSVTIPNGVTSIETSTFVGCSSLTSVTIPNSVTSIGNNAFQDCSGLTSMAIPNGVTSIGGGAFRNCSGLTSVTIPNSVTSINSYVFEYCSGLTSVTIPNSVTSIDLSAFTGCTGLTEIYIHNPTPPSADRSAFDEQNYKNATLYVPEEAYDTYDNMVDGPWNYFMKLQSFKTSSAFYFDYYDNNMTATFVGVKDKTASPDIIIPETTTYNGKTYTVTAIGAMAFKDYGVMTSVTIPNSVTYIGESAFYGCSGLTSVTIPNSVTSIGKSAFEDCSGLTKVNISDLVAWCNIKFSANPLFYAHHLYLNGEEVTNLVIPDCITSIGNNVFPGCSGLTSVAIPNSVTSIGSSAFSGCSGLTSVTIPNSVTSIGRSAFHGCSGLTSVTIPNSVTSIGDYAFYNSGLTSVTIPNSVTSIGSYTFEYCSSLTEVTILNGVTSIGTRAFYDCSSLTSVTIPNSVTSIGFGAFWDCSGLTSVTIPNSVTSIGGRAFSGCGGLTEVYSLNPTPPSIGAYDNPFSDIYQKATLYVPEEALEAYRNAEGWKNFKNIQSVESLMLYYFEYNDNNMTATITRVNKDKVSSELVIPETTTHNDKTYTIVAISKEAFKDCSMASVTIPSGITSIGDGAFKNCTGLTKVNISDIAAWCNIKFSSVYSSSSNPLYYAHHLYINGEEVKDLVIPDGIASINNYAFRDCSGLTSVTIPNSVTAIGWSAFSGCSGLTEVTIPNGVTSIGWLAFSGCSGMTSVTIPNSVTSIESSAFRDCSGLISVTIPNSVTSIGYAAFYQCSGLTSVTIPNSVTAIGDEAFRGCSGLTSVTIPNSVTSIGDEAFRGCSGLTSVTIPNSVTSIGNNAFRWCSGLTEVYSLNLTPPSTGAEYGPFGNDIYQNATLYVPNEAVDAYVNADGWKEFQNINGLESSAFKFDYDNSNMTATVKGVNKDKITSELVIPETTTHNGKTYSVVAIGWTAFKDCSGLTSVTIPNSVTSIGSSAFSGCSGLTEVTIPNSVTSIGNEAFYDCEVLTKVNILDIASWCNIEFSPDIFAMPHHFYINGEEVKHIVIPDGVTSIARWTFQGCIGFTEVTIPNSVTSIGDNAFSNCRGLTKVYSFNVTPPSASYDKSADDIYMNATLYVPNEAVKAYMDAEFWKEFQNIKGFDPTGIQGIEVDESRGQDVYYDLNGRRLSAPRKGLNIINGKKVIIK